MIYNKLPTFSLDNYIEEQMIPLSKKESFKDFIEMLGDWVIAVKKISENGSSENIIRIKNLINTFPPAPNTPNEVISLRSKLVNMIREEKSYDKDLKTIANRALVAYENQYQHNPENKIISFDELDATEIED